MSAITARCFSCKQDVPFPSDLPTVTCPECSSIQTFDYCVHCEKRGTRRLPNDPWPCSYCGETNAAPTPPAPVKPDRAGLWAVLVLVLAAGGCVAISSGGEDDPPDRSLQAQSICQTAVENRLKAPSTADFSRWGEAPTGTVNGWTVEGMVDAENSFGAKIRSAFTCDLHRRGERWYVDAVRGLS
jgi:hypothetical protein